MTIALVVLLTLGAGLISASFFEWTVHKYLLHRPLKFFRYGFESHAKIHHTIFKWEESYHAQKEEDMHTIHMVKWSPVIIIGGSLPYLILILAFTLFNLEHSRIVAVTGISGSILYYIAYEYLHWCMHLPKGRRLEMSRVFQRMNGHHLLHHRYMNKNYNVVFPFADWCLGTLLVRSPVAFRQARGPGVPDVQPLT